MSSPSPPEDVGAERATAVLLGASNLVWGAASLLATVRRALPAGGLHGGLDLLAACGHGRSYGTSSTVWGRTLPAILDCGLWDELERRRPAALRALITDVGNDVGYGRDAATIAGWIEECAARLERLAAGGGRLVLTALPVANLLALPAWQIGLARRLFFPFSRVTPSEARREVRELDRRLREIARRHGIFLVEQEPAWYGLDPIHLRRRLRPQAWARILAPWHEGETLEPVAAEPRPGWWPLAGLRPERCWLFGREQRGGQPAAVLEGNLRLFLY